MEYIDIDKSIVVTDTRGRERETTVRHILDINKGVYKIDDVQPVRHGRWNEESPDALDGDSVYVCSVCGETWTLIEGTPLDNNMHYCPKCGAKMGEEEE